MIRAIAFDFDGVLVESVDVKTRAYAHLFKEYGQDVVSKVVGYHMKNGGISRFVKLRTIYEKILKKPLSEKKFELLSEQFSNIVVDAVVAAPWVEGAQEFLQKNKNRYLYFIVSGTPQEELELIVQRRQMEQYFCAVLGSPKNKVDLFREVLPRLNLTPEETVFVGDAETDWNAAKAIGLAFLWRCVSGEVRLLNGYAGPKMTTLSSLEENLKILKKQIIL
jgi:HAD superfamily hydrolase (TIGR01509 family)